MKKKSKKGGKYGGKMMKKGQTLSQEKKFEKTRKSVFGMK